MDELTTRRLAKKIKTREMLTEQDMIGFITTLKYFQEFSPTANIIFSLSGDELWVDIEALETINDHEDITFDVQEITVTTRRLIIPFVWKGNDPHDYNPHRTINNVIEDIELVIKLLSTPTL